jgi:hypothetical protein
MSCLASFHRNKLSAFFFFQGPVCRPRRIASAQAKRKEKRETQDTMFFGEKIELILLLHLALCPVCCVVRWGVNDGNDL